MNMLRLRRRIDSTARTKNGHPPHSTTGVASSSSTGARARAGTSSVMATISNGTVIAAETHNRRAMSISSGFFSSTADATRGSSAIPHIGQLPAASRTTSGCIGQVHCAPGGAVTTGRGGAAATNAPGSALNRSRHQVLQK